jgi:hypothetical protein
MLHGDLREARVDRRAAVRLSEPQEILHACGQIQLAGVLELHRRHGGEHLADAGRRHMCSGSSTAKSGSACVSARA